MPKSREGLSSIEQVQKFRELEELRRRLEDWEQKARAATHEYSLTDEEMEADKSAWPGYLVTRTGTSYDVPEYDQAMEKIRSLKVQIEKLKTELEV